MSKSYYLLSNIFFIFLLFPYTTFGLPSFSDSQPWAAVYGLFIILVFVSLGRIKKIPSFFWWLWILAFFCIINDTLYLSSNDFIRYARYIFKYISFAAVVPATVILIEGFNVRFLKVSIFLWWVISNLQYVLKKPLVTFILPRASYTIGRSWTIGFAPEAGFLAKVSVFFLLLIDYFVLMGKIGKKEALFFKLLSFWMIIISYSLTGILLLTIYLLISVFIWLSTFKGFSIRKIIISVGLISVLIVFFPIVFPDLQNLFLSLSGRVWAFLRSAFGSNNFINALRNDPSFNARFSHIQASFDTILEGNIFGSGNYDRIIGSIFSPLYDSGVYGVLFIVLIFWGFISSIYYIKDKETKLFVFEVLLMFVFMTFSESLATNYIAALLGIALYLKYSYKNRKSQQYFS